MRQRCITGCKSYSAPAPSEEQAETRPSPPDAGRQPLGAGAQPADAGITPAASDLRPPDAGELTEDAGIKAPTRAPAFRIAGANPPRDPYRIIHVAWTMDDGPTPATPKMKTVMGGRPTTWFIMCNQLGTGAKLKANLAELQALQATGHEIAIHSAHPTAARVSWFPVKVAGAVPLAYDSVQAFIADLADFTELLKQHGITPTFVRMPGGEITEVSAYLRAQGVADSETRNRLARKILRQESVAGESAGVENVAADYDAIRAALDVLGLKLWGGSSGGPTISFQSWEAESSASGLTDNVTTFFKRLVNEFATERRERSLIVLAHDTNEGNAKEVQKDIREMEGYPDANGVQIRYHTLSGLLTQVRGVAP
jgi:peptidoglycan/xylan/chitin deacetylase (PgdA/CDA1 family)